MNEIPKESLEAVLISLLSAVKSMQFYPREHPSVQKPLRKSYDLLAELLRLNPMMTLGIVDEVLVFEGVPFYDKGQSIQEIQRRFEERQINALELHDGLSLEEFTAFIGLLNDDPEEVKTLGGLSKGLNERGIEHIKAKDAVEVYHNAIDAVGEVLQEARMGRIPKAGRARNAVADLKRLVLSDNPTLLALTLIKSYDNYLFNHSVNVSVLALSLAHGMGVPDLDVSDVGLAGLLHDIGKTLTPKSIILKPGKLNDDEWRVMRMHPVKSAEIVEQMEGISPLVARMVREHHVSFDRRGYPQLEPGENPHHYSKIITVADCYDAITTLRPYQKPFHPREAMKIMERLSGTVIDPKYYEEFVKILGIFPIGSLVRLDTNEIAVVLETFAEAPLAPKIRIMFDPDGRPLPTKIDVDLSCPESYPGDPKFIVSTVDPLLYNVDTESIA